MKKNLLLLFIFIYGILGNIIYNIILIYRDRPLDFLITDYFIPCGIGIIISILGVISIIKKMYMRTRWKKQNIGLSEESDTMDRSIHQNTEFKPLQSKLSNILIMLSKLAVILVILGDIFYYLLITLVAALIGDWARNGMQYHFTYTFPNLAVIVSLIYYIGHLLHKFNLTKPKKY